MTATPRARATLAAVALVTLAAAALTGARAASVLDFDVWMRAIDQRSVAVQKKHRRAATPMPPAPTRGNSSASTA